ncbi:DUF5007 domain-containing protein [Pedobacter miscanthi]|uniref:DUF5007 domain-containing protein n=1 Tax=Pedobacter miscanthi TaxID=2259170 RepID=UPI00292EE0D5|nr:DUF5007 domain-containing protein [Pedobacter miscanthi]
MSILKNNRILFLFAVIMLFSACKKIFEFPEEKEFLSPDLNYKEKLLQPILGRTLILGSLNSASSTLPLQLEIVNARFGNGRPVTDLFQLRPTYVWTAPYTGLEKTLEEIASKRKLENHPLFEVRGSGQFIFWGSSSNELVKPRAADSSNFPQDSRFFDLKVTNSGGTMMLKDFEIRMFRERPYEPSNDFNYYSGKVAYADEVTKKGINYLLANINNVLGVSTKKNMVNNSTTKNLVVYIRPFTGGNGHNLRIKVLGRDSVALNPKLFGETKWTTMLHAFNMQKTDEYVQYDVAYPIPLAPLPTVYAPNGTRAVTKIEYSRLGPSGIRQFSSFGIDFAIFKEGDWEIVFHFKNENPKFEDD